MKQKFKIQLILLFSLLVLMSACRKSLNSLYSNPDSFTSTSIEYLFPTGIYNSVPIQYGDAVNRYFYSFAPMMQLLANDQQNPTAMHLYQFVQASSSSSAGQVDFGRWSFYYNTAMPQLKEIEKIYDWELTPQQQQGYKVYYELTKIIEAYNTAMNTDLFGDMPYSQAFTARNSIYGQPVTLYPVFDSQQSIYDSILNDLQNAAAYLDTAQLHPEIYSVQGLLAGQDILFQGKLSKWERLANSLRLRYAMRISAADKATATQVISDIVQNNRPLILEDSSNAYLYNSAQNGQSGLFEAVQGSAPGSVYAPEYMDSIMQAANDPRLPIFFYSNSSAYTGMPVSYGDRNHTAGGYTGSYAYLNPLVFGFNYTMPNGIMITAADVNFLLSEAAVKGYITGGSATAEKYYNEGIVQSILAYYNFYSTAPAQQIVNTSDTLNKVSIPVPTENSILSWLSASAYKFDASNAIAQIATQKWLNSFILEMDDNYAEFRRLGLPKLPADYYNGVQINKTYPVRVPYPSSEQANNETNFDKAAAATDGNSYTTPVWWNK